MPFKFEVQQYLVQNIVIMLYWNILCVWYKNLALFVSKSQTSKNVPLARLTHYVYAYICGIYEAYLLTAIKVMSIKIHPNV